LSVILNTIYRKKGKKSQWVFVILLLRFSFNVPSRSMRVHNQKNKREESLSRLQFVWQNDTVFFSSSSSVKKKNQVQHTSTMESWTLGPGATGAMPELR
jgi:hypothetical protein